MKISTIAYVVLFLAIGIATILGVSIETCHPHTMMISGHILTGEMCGTVIESGGKESPFLFPIFIVGTIFTLFLPGRWTAYLLSLWLMVSVSLLAYRDSTMVCHTVTGKYDGKICQNTSQNTHYFHGKYYSHTGDYTVE